MNYLLLDGNSIGMACQDSTKLRVGNIETQAIYGFLRTVKRLIEHNPGYKPIILWDGRAQWRFDLFPPYKGNREIDPKIAREREAYRQQRPHISRAMETLGVAQMTDFDAEADDLAGYLSRWLGVGDNRIKLITGDRDWCQLVNKNVSWHCHRTDRNCTHNNFTEFTGFKTPQLFVEAKCLMGDASDNVPGVGGIGKEGVPPFFETYGSTEGFFKQYDEGELAGKKLLAALKRFGENEAPRPSKKYGELLPMRDAYYRNQRLMNLVDSDYKPSKRSLEVKKGKFNLDGFMDICDEFMFLSICRSIEGWTLPFKRLAEQQ